MVVLSPLRPRAPVPIERAALYTCVGLLVAAAWFALSSTGGSLFSHAHHAVHHGLEQPAFFLFFISSWTVMTVAMMLPTSLPILATLHTFAHGRKDRWLLVALAIIGYIGTWSLFGTVAYLGYFALGTLSYIPVGAPLLLLVAGGFQFTSLKYKCLDKCRSPFSVVVEHWQGRRERWQSLRLGVSHGIFCVGCCWALMLLMFVLTSASLVWMLILAIVMAVEKNVSWGRRLSAPVGVALVVWGLVSLF
jgi:predicted metal-binding membrane protein